MKVTDLKRVSIGATLNAMQLVLSGYNDPLP